MVVLTADGGKISVMRVLDGEHYQLIVDLIKNNEKKNREQLINYHVFKNMYVFLVK